MRGKGVSPAIILIVVAVIIAAAVGSAYVIMQEDGYPKVSISSVAFGDFDNEMRIYVLSGSIEAREWVYSVSATRGSYNWVIGAEPLDAPSVSLGTYASGTWYVSLKHISSGHTYFTDELITKPFLGQDLDLLKNSDGKIVSCELLDVDTYSENLDCYRLRYLSDGLEVVGFLIKPKQGDGYPAVIFNRGGEKEFGKIDNSALAYLSYVASVENFVVVASQYRGNDGGEGREEFGGSDVNDVLNLIPMLESLPFVNSDKIAMLGYSRGGMMTYIAITMTDKVKAACAVGGVTDLIQTYNEREYGMKQILIELIGGAPEEKENEYKKRSAYYWPEKINTPVLILHGEADWRVKVSQAEKLANELEELGKVYELVVYPGGSHGLSEYYEDRDCRILEWFENYLQ